MKDEPNCEKYYHLRIGFVLKAELLFQIRLVINLRFTDSSRSLRSGQALGNAAKGSAERPRSE
jgi:hypothetical protein